MFVTLSGECVRGPWQIQSQVPGGLMKMPIAYVVATLALAAATSGHAASPDKALVWRDYTDTVAPADQQAYEAGVKAFNQCLGEHHVKFSMPTVVHETGNDYQYSSVVGPVTWADMDTLSAEIKPCDATWRAQGNPHLKGETSAFMVLQPELSHLPADWQSRPNPPMLFITYFTLKPGHEHNMAFSDTFKKVAAVLEHHADLGWRRRRARLHPGDPEEELGRRRHRTQPGPVEDDGEHVRSVRRGRDTQIPRRRHREVFRSLRPLRCQP